MAKKENAKTIKATKLSSFLNKNRNKSVNVSIVQKNLQLSIHGEVHRHDDQFWITKGGTKTIVELKQTGGFLSRLMSWPDKRYTMSIQIIVGGDTVANMTLPVRAKDKLPYSIG